MRRGHQARKSGPPHRPEDSQGGRKNQCARHGGGGGRRLGQARSLEPRGLRPKGLQRPGGNRISRETPQHPSTGLWATCPHSPAPGQTPKARGTDRADGDALGEAVVGRDVLVQLLGGPLPQAGAVVALIEVEDGWSAVRGHVSTDGSRPQSRPARASRPAIPALPPVLPLPSPTRAACPRWHPGVQSCCPAAVLGELHCPSVLTRAGS